MCVRACEYLCKRIAIDATMDSALKEDDARAKERWRRLSTNRDRATSGPVSIIGQSVSSLLHQYFAPRCIPSIG